MHETGIQNPHDRLFRSYYKYPAAAASLLRQALPPDIAAHIDYSTLRNEEDTFITPSLREYIADLVFSCRLTGGDRASIYVLVEHKSAPDTACAVQVLRYISLLWEDHLAKYGAREPLPIVVPVLFYHGKTGWNVKQLDQLFPSDAPLREFIPIFRMLVYSLKKAPEEQLLKQPADNAMLLLLKALTDTYMQRKLAQYLQVLLRKEFAEQSEEIIRQFLAYLEQVQPEITPDALVREMETLPEGEETMQTFMERLSELAYEKALIKGKAEGIAEGIEKGIAEGEVKAARNMLRTLLNTRFEVVPMALSARLENIHDVAALNGLAAAVLKTDSLEAFEALVDKALNGAQREM